MCASLAARLCRKCGYNGERIDDDFIERKREREEAVKWICVRESSTALLSVMHMYNIKDASV